MNLDRGLIAAILREGDSAVKKCRMGIPDSTFLKGESQKVYDYILDYISSYGGCPSNDLIKQHLGIDFEDAADPLGLSEATEAPVGFWIDEIKKRRLFESLKATASLLYDELEKGEVDNGLAILESSLVNIRKDQLSGDTGVEKIGPLGKEALEFYERMHRGERGIPLPWEGINDATLGIWPQDLGLFVARPGTGKTWAAVLIALHAWEQGHKVLFATTEISRPRIAMRLLCAKYKLDYGKFRKGELTSDQEKFFRAEVLKLQDDESFFVAGGDFDFKISNYRALIEEVKPDLCILDGAYLLKVEGKDRTQKTANAFDEIKRISNATSVPQIATMQFNRNAKTNMTDSLDLSNIAQSDAAGWNADFAYAMDWGKEGKAGGRMIFKPMKVREGFGESLTVNWNFKEMDFTEVPKDSSDVLAPSIGFGSTVFSRKADKPEESSESEESKEEQKDDFPF